MKAFKAYDIRGIYNEDFNKEDVYKIGFFIPQVLETDKVLIGRDVRESSPEILEYLIKGILDSGSDVYYAGLATTPMIYYSSAKFGFAASVMITASHNSAEYNGLKVSGKNAKPIGYDTGLNQIEKLMQSQEIIACEKKGKYHEINVKDTYFEFLKSYVPDLNNLKISMDISNGMAALFIKDLLGDKVMYFYDELDGSFPNHEANPLVAKNIVDLQKHVIENKSDIGVIFDGDADRVMFVDENGKFISPDLMIAVLSHYFLEEKALKGKVIQDIRTSKAVGEYISQFGSKMEMWRVGRAFAATKLKEIDGIFGGELAGHYYFKDFYYSDSGILACLLILRVLAQMHKKGIKVSEFIAKIKKYENSGEINFKIEDKLKAMDTVINYFKEKEKPEAFFDFDGYRIEYKNWWLNIRPSNTEPYLRFLAEANSQKLLKEIVDKVVEIVKNHGGKLTSGH
ncbi:MAG: phosphomannomutase/phosphoglucomutase [Bacteroidales bacterium]|jgi:phosphomannomutase|nr:phosphomannomutase/phosphoglucomutase [Bacteroidales bacterium]NLB87171.1 phosphomannomutase/phosphoglucomutase [Bacteroidales bacterium]